MSSNLRTQPPISTSFQLTYPSPGILLVTISRPKAMNSIPYPAHYEADEIFQWFDNEPSLRVAIITGSGKKAFCAGQDLIELNNAKSAPSFSSESSSNGRPGRGHPPTGFAGISRRVGKKPIIAAVNGFALGGGFEICLNCDLVVASPTATFGLPEAQVGLYAAAGGLPRLVRNVGLPIASEIALTNRRLSASEALNFNLINKISQSQESVVEEAVELAKKIVKLSPDGVIVSRAGLREAWETASVEEARKKVADRFEKGLFEGENMRIGLKAFATKTRPVWVPSKL
ncbi:putative carnitinyl-CoA dehydratase [Acephala macrosclerotiorum]|nr:putative carnitinyl-CoA dehydratase [Acephala macrosclerotiorum]